MMVHVKNTSFCSPWLIFCRVMKICICPRLGVRRRMLFSRSTNLKCDNAMKGAGQDIRTGHIKFYWAGSVGVGPVGVPMEVAKKYPRANAGVGCVTNDIPLRERPEDLPAGAAQKIYAYVTQKH